MNRLRMDVVLLTSVIATGCVTACSGTRDKVTTPTSVAPPEAVGSTPPAVDRGQAPVPQPFPPASGSCDASKAQFAVGERASADLLERARAAAGASAARFIRPNQPITTEYLGSRLNLGLNHRDVVASASCG
jgi:hypothetical protein